METYRLEFHEKQQNFHLEDGKHQENTNGWFTVIDEITYFEFVIFDAFVNRRKNKTITKKYLEECIIELDEFKKLLKGQFTGFVEQIIKYTK